MAVSGTKGVGKGPFGAFGTGNGIPEGTGAVRTGFGNQNGRQTAGNGQNRPDLAGRPDPAPVFRIPYSSDSLMNNDRLETTRFRPHPRIGALESDTLNYTTN